MPAWMPERRRTEDERLGPVILFVDEDDAVRSKELVSASEAGSLAPEADEGPALD